MARARVLLSVSQILVSPDSITTIMQVTFWESNLLALGTRRHA
jgi:hypothetical protein